MMEIRILDDCDYYYDNYEILKYSCYLILKS